MCATPRRYSAISTDRHFSGQSSICSKGKRVLNAVTQHQFIIVLVNIIIAAAVCVSVIKVVT